MDIYAEVTEFYEGTKALKVDEISDIVETSYGYHIIKRLPLPEFSEDVYNEISATLNLENEREFKTAILNESNVVCHMTDEEIIAKILKQ